MSKLSVATTQMACSWETEDNVARAEAMVREAAARGARIVLIQELFETPYFCIEQEFKHLDLARPADDSPLIERMSKLAAELEVVLPVSFFERAGNAFCLVRTRPRASEYAKGNSKVESSIQFSGSSGFGGCLLGSPPRLYVSGIR